ncbi:MAG: hypothetical protein WCL42_07470 [Chlorobiaceae bacterium]|jgi:predicted HTH transcriptional regulator
MKIEGLLRRPEGKTLEFKQDLSSPKNILKTASSPMQLEKSKNTFSLLKVFG